MTLVFPAGSVAFVAAFALVSLLIVAGLFVRLVVLEKVAMRKQRKVTFSERFVLAGGKRVRVSVASYGGVFMPTADAILLAGEAVKPTEKKMVYVGRASNGRRGEVVTYSAWFAEAASIDFSNLWLASDLSTARELELREEGDWAASSPDEGETCVGDSSPDTLEDELVRALKMAATPARNPLDVLAARTPADRLRDGE